MTERVQKINERDGHSELKSYKLLIFSSTLTFDPLRGHAQKSAEALSYILSHFKSN